MIAVIEQGAVQHGTNEPTDSSIDVEGGTNEALQIGGMYQNKILPPPATVE